MKIHTATERWQIFFIVKYCIVIVITFFFKNLFVYLFGFRLVLYNIHYTNTTIIFCTDPDPENFNRCLRSGSRDIVVFCRRPIGVRYYDYNNRSITRGRNIMQCVDSRWDRSIRRLIVKGRLKRIRRSTIKGYYCFAHCRKKSYS